MLETKLDETLTTKKQLENKERRNLEKIKVPLSLFFSFFFFDEESLQQKW